MDWDDDRGRDDEDAARRGLVVAVRDDCRRAYLSVDGSVIDDCRGFSLAAWRFQKRPWSAGVSSGPTDVLSSGNGSVAAMAPGVAVTQGGVCGVWCGKRWMRDARCWW